MDLGTAVVVGLCVFLVLWYGGAHLYNRRRGRRLFRWLETGLDVLGGQREAGWIGSSASGARVNVTHARLPFRRLEITLLLARREVPLLWLFDHLRGRRDGLIIKATLRSPRRGEVEVRPTRGIVGLGQEQPWAFEEGPRGFTVAYRGPGAQQQVAGLKPWLGVYGSHLQRFSWQRHDPHIQLQVNVAEVLATPSERFLADLRAAVGEATHVNK